MIGFMVAIAPPHWQRIVHCCLRLKVVVGHSVNFVGKPNFKTLHLLSPGGNNIRVLGQNLVIFQKAEPILFIE